MNKLVLIYENITSGYIDEVLNISYLFIIVCGIVTIIIKNPISSILFLIGLFSGIAVYLILVGLSFIGLSYLIVYVGAVSILFLFILMLINIRTSELQSNTINSIPLVLILIFLFISPLLKLLYSDPISWNNNSIMNIVTSVKSVFFVVSSHWDAYLAQLEHITGIGSIIYTNFSTWIIIISLILLLSMVGTIVITMK